MLSDLDMLLDVAQSLNVQQQALIHNAYYFTVSDGHKLQLTDKANYNMR